MTFQIVFEHLAMVIVALLFALIAGVPLGILSYFYPRAGKIILRQAVFRYHQRLFITIPVL